MTSDLWMLVLNNYQGYADWFKYIQNKVCFRITTTSVVRHTLNSSYRTKSAAHYKEKFFPGGECLHATIKDAAQTITFTHVKPNNNIRMKCALDFFK